MPKFLFSSACFGCIFVGRVTATAQWLMSHKPRTWRWRWRNYLLRLSTPSLSSFIPPPFLRSSFSCHIYTFILSSFLSSFLHHVYMYNVHNIYIGLGLCVYIYVQIPPSASSLFSSLPSFLPSTQGIFNSAATKELFFSHCIAVLLPVQHCIATRVQ